MGHDPIFDMDGLEAKAREELPTNEGHLALLADLSALFGEATKCQFHDYLNTDYPFPKKELIQRLETLVANVKEGKYDN